ncbi:Fatty acyl-CoA reductase [Gimesia panareensis]|uniref:Fatty acyl-CoA reductase n=1 Tax=Gimesia panareensis TaxID=2527978 RepID=A0A518FSA3_9PLAN|nr:SDR family NAD(P)-dependent oxidoreductase [Gimesia panareensis]QDV19190.1 Fatty acyl-CoA reductase [Gimesia panareensis]
MEDQQQFMEQQSLSLSQVSEEELLHCARILQLLSGQPERCLNSATASEKVWKQAALLTKRVKNIQKQAGRNRDRQLIEQAGIRGKRKTKTDGRYLYSDDETPVGTPETSLHHSRRCYICKQSYQQLHPFYDLMCASCGQENYQKRTQTADLAGRIAVVTGGRVKIGFQIALKLLRSGARVLVTSRFPCDAARRYAAETDFEEWHDRLQIFGSDFRSLQSVNQLCDDLQVSCSHLDILINNASQTIRRPAAYYRHLLDGESAPGRLAQSARRLIYREGQTQNSALDAHALSRFPEELALSAMLSQSTVLPEDAEHDQRAFPPGLLDSDSQQVDLREANSWIQELGDVSLPELLEVHAVNSLVPFLLIQKMEPLLLNSPHGDRYIVNVSAMEGQLNTDAKTGYHPHTNMAKAGMNMVTRTSGERFAGRCIYMNSVDTGWVTNEFPHQKTAQMQQHGFQPPLDEIDGAARVCDPVFVGINERHYLYGKFLKDYRETSW